ncbi:SdpI family protein [Pseudostreptobacillus hongkongensis]|uniref:SdpI family protein n=1 Tax=Pseudostreptobacillus hongkongensis TaxID=1162717 RepID=UPI0008298740|nr:SdpI family protein [Pseudostreptobacillus hongkongensis]
MKNNSKLILYVFVIAFFVILSLISDQSLKLILSGLCLMAMSIFMYFNLEDITEVSKDNPKFKNLKIFLIICSVITILFFVLTITSKNNKLDSNNFKYIYATLIFILFLILGNLAPKLPMNKNIGLRVPWTLKNVSTWNATHRFLGYLSIILAIIYLPGVFIIPNFALWTSFIVLVLVILSTIFSYVYYNKNKD